jgi:hypothetical protein
MDQEVKPIHVGRDEYPSLGLLLHLRDQVVPVPEVLLALAAKL